MRQLMLGLLLAMAAAGAIAQSPSATAFAVAPELLVTNQHAIAGCSTIEIISADGRRKGSVAAADADLDLAVLRVTGLKGPTARLRNPRVVRLGESVMVFGYPLAGALSSGGNFTAGLVSALRGLRDAAGEVQITAPVQPGNSGGPLLDSSGLVIGVVQGKLDALRTVRATGDIPQNVNFAISLEVLADFLARNKVVFRDGTASAKLDAAQVAELAQSFTHRIECRVGPQRAERSAPQETSAARPNAGSQRAERSTARAYAGSPRAEQGELAFWNSVKDSDRMALLASYLEKYPHGQFVDAARGQLRGGNWLLDTKGCRIWDQSPEPGETVEWTGGCIDGKGSGRGRLTWRAGNKIQDHEFTTLESGWVNGAFAYKQYVDNQVVFAVEGTASYSSDGHYRAKVKKIFFTEQRTVNSFEGFEEDGRPTTGLLTYRNGNTFKGPFKNSKPHGVGVYAWTNGTKYEGDFVDGRQTGRAKVTYASGAVYEGSVENGRQHGFGKLTYANNVVYEGDFVNGQPQGKGTFSFSDGGQYIGEVVGGKPHGSGVMIDARGNRRAGEFVAGKRIR